MNDLEKCLNEPKGESFKLSLNFNDFKLENKNSNELQLFFNNRTHIATINWGTKTIHIYNLKYLSIPAVIKLNFESFDCHDDLHTLELFYFEETHILTVNYTSGMIFFDSPPNIKCPILSVEKCKHPNGSCLNCDLPSTL